MRILTLAQFELLKDWMETKKFENKLFFPDRCHCLGSLLKSGRPS